MEPNRGDSFVAAGSFGAWLEDMRAVLRGEKAADVPCGSCVGCCISSYPIPLRPGDERARAEVPEQMLIGRAEPGRDWLMGFREDGSCPFLTGARTCSIYANRPHTCRDYDCRIYAAARLLPDGERPDISSRVRAWRFDVDTAEDAAAAAAVQRAAQFIRAHSALFPPAMRAASATAASVLAIKTYAVFLAAESGQQPEETVRQVIESAMAFERAAERARDQGL
jgi:uncharacterized protein